MRSSHLSSLLAGFVLLAFQAGAQAASDPTFDPSLASPLLQSKAQIRIFAVDDAADTTCKSREFIQVTVVTRPTVVQVAPKVRRRKWQEQWTMDRCGEPIGYRMFFTDLGDGGAYFSYRPMPTVRLEADSGADSGKAK